jgi:hypothetical protein
VPPSQLHNLVLTRLEAETRPEDEWGALVLAGQPQAPGTESEVELLRLLVNLPIHDPAVAWE